MAGGTIARSIDHRGGERGNSRELRGAERTEQLKRHKFLSAIGSSAADLGEPSPRRGYIE